jgi:hypothetical protein
MNDTRFDSTLFAGFGLRFHLSAELLRFDVTLSASGNPSANKPRLRSSRTAAARHPASEPPIVEHPQFILAEHDLQPFDPTPSTAIARSRGRPA